MDERIIPNELGTLGQSPFNDIEIDWEEYFNQFCKAHGNYPVVITDNNDTEFLLFQDGWMYSSTSHEGPEYPPPDDSLELITLRLRYWKRRYNIVKTEHDTLKFNLEQLKNVIRSKTLPLYQKVQYKSEDGKIVSGSSKLDLSPINRRIQWLAQDIAKCIKEIGYLEARISFSGIHPASR